MVIKDKKCPGCKRRKPKHLFYKDKNRSDGIRGLCKRCTDKRTGDRRQSEKGKKYQKNYDLYRSYGISLKMYEHMLLSQKNRCAICGKSSKKFKKNLAVDHCHVTKKIRGLLCTPCNRGIGNFYDNVRLMKKAIKYLEINNA